MIKDKEKMTKKLRAQGSTVNTILEMFESFYTITRSEKNDRNWFFMVADLYDEDLINAAFHLM